MLIIPKYRQTGTTGPTGQRRNRQGHVDHDMFEGLPVRHWRRDLITVAPSTVDDPPVKNDIWAVELPHGMPKDSHLLPQHSQDLLRAARSGKIFRRPSQEEEEAEAEALVGEKDVKKEQEVKGFVARAWKQIPRHQEGPDIGYEYLAPRRKGVITVAQSLEALYVPTVIKAKVRRIDAAGNEYVQDVISAHGQPIEGEVISQTTIADPTAAAAAVASAPIKRKAPPKRKGRAAIGRGRKKVKIQAPISRASVSEIVVSAPVESAAASTVAPVRHITMLSLLPANSFKVETPGRSRAVSASNYTEVGSEDEGSDGEEGGENDEYGRREHSSPLKSRPGTATTIDPPDTVMLDDEGGDQYATSSSIQPHIYSVAIKPDDNENEPPESPLPAVATTTSTLTSPAASPRSSAAFVSEYMDTDPALPPATLPPPDHEGDVSRQPTSEVAFDSLAKESKIGKELLEEEEEEETMLLDLIDEADSRLPPDIRAPAVTRVFERTGVVPDGSPIATEVKNECKREITGEAMKFMAAIGAPQGITQSEAKEGKAQVAGRDAVESFPDLLGSLEQSLDAPDAKAHTPGSAYTEIELEAPVLAAGRDKLKAERRDEAVGTSPTAHQRAEEELKRKITAANSHDPHLELPPDVKE